jgi:hypothetical protein
MSNLSRPPPEEEQTSVTEQILGGQPDREQAVVRIRVGRWTYDATIAEDGTATFTTKLGGARRRPGASTPSPEPDAHQPGSHLERGGRGGVTFRRVPCQPGSGGS